MEDDSDTLQVKKKIFPTTLQILTSIYALLYLIFIIENFFHQKILILMILKISSSIFHSLGEKICILQIKVPLEYLVLLQSS